MFTITLKEMTSEYATLPVQGCEFKSIHNCIKEARKAVRKLKKIHKLINHGGYIVNYRSRLELTTNF